MTNQAVKRHVWTDTMVAILKKGWKRGDSKRKIASDVGHGVTKNAAGGKAFRLNLGQHPSNSGYGQVHRVRHIVHVARKVTRTVPVHIVMHTGIPSMPYVPVSHFTN